MCWTSPACSRRWSARCRCALVQVVPAFVSLAVACLRPIDMEAQAAALSLPLLGTFAAANKL